MYVAGRIVPSRYKAAAASYKKDDKPAVIRSRKVHVFVVQYNVELNCLKIIQSYGSTL